MSKRIAASLLVCLLAGSVASAQVGGSGTGGGRSHGGGRRSGSGDPSSSTSNAPSASAPAQKPMSEIGIIGVVKKIDAPNARITIQYEAVDDLDLPAGAQAFAVSKSALLNGVSVGEKVRFTLESHQVADLKPFVPPPAPE